MFERYLETLSQLWQYIQVLRTTGTVKKQTVFAGTKIFFIFALLSNVFTPKDQNMTAPKEPVSSKSLYRS